MPVYPRDTLPRFFFMPLLMDGKKGTRMRVTRSCVVGMINGDGKEEDSCDRLVDQYGRSVREIKLFFVFPSGLK